MPQKPDVLEVVELKRKQERRVRALRAMREVLSTDQGKEAVWYIATSTGFFAEKLLEASSMVYANAALRDFGRELIAFLVEANEKAIFDQQQIEWHRAVTERLEDEKLLKDKED